MMLCPESLTGAAPRAFAVTYDEPLLRRAVAHFLWRRAILGRPLFWLASAGLLGIALYGALTFRGGGLLVGLFLAIGLLPPLGLFLIWRGHLAACFGRYRAMEGGVAEVTVSDRGLAVRSSLGRGEISWQAITEVWALPDAFLVFSAPAAFNILPAATMPPALRDALAEAARVHAR